MYSKFVINYRLMDYIKEIVQTHIEESLEYRPNELKVLLAINDLMNVVDTSKFDDDGLGMIDESVIDMTIEEIKEILQEFFAKK